METWRNTVWEAASIKFAVLSYDLRPPQFNRSLTANNHFMKLLLSAKGQKYFKEKGGWFNALIGNHVNK